jgi:LysR family transcriptional regulator, regulator of abg operon
MRLKQIQDFVSVIEAGSIHAAARKCGVSQPAITKSVRALEAELHVQLLRRTNHGVVPTPAGRSFFARARVADAELRKAREEMTQLGDGAQSSVAFGIGPTAGRLIAADAITDFRRQHPGTQVRILEGYAAMLLPLVREETLDFAIGARPDGKLDPPLAFRPLFRHDFLVAARKGHPMRNARSLAQLVDADWLGLLPFSLPDGPLERAFLSGGLPRPRMTIQSDSHNIVIAVLAKTDMVGIVSNRLLAAPLVRDLLQPIAVAERLPSFTAGIFTRNDTSLTRPAAAMAKAVTLAARRLTGSASGAS